MRISIDIQPKLTLKGYKVFGSEFKTKEEANKEMTRFVIDILANKENKDFEVKEEDLYSHIFYVDGRYRQYLFSYYYINEKDIQVRQVYEINI